MDKLNNRLMIIVYTQALFFSLVAIILSVISIPLLFVMYVGYGVVDGVKDFKSDFRGIIIDSSTKSLIERLKKELIKNN